MEKDLKDILLKDLCARLPYGVKCKISRKHGPIRINNCVLDCYWLTEVRSDFYEIKPYLFPLSSMTEEQKMFLRHQNWCIAISKSRTGEPIIETTTEGFDWLIKNHFDFRGLIPKGLANDATELNIY